LLVLALGACFSKPPFSPADDAGGSDAPSGEVASRGRLAASGRHACRIDELERVICWGDNRWGQLGLRGDVDIGEATGTPGLASPDGGWTWIAAGKDHTCGIRDHAVYCWGANGNGQSGPDRGTTSAPTEVPVPGEAARVFAGDTASCAITTDGRAFCWGGIDLQASGGTTRGVTELRPGTRFAEIAIARDHACALEDGGDETPGAVYCWGQGSQGQLGRPPDPFVPLEVPFDAADKIESARRFRSIAAAPQATCGITDDRQLACWGSGATGHLGPFADVTSTELEIDAAGRPWARIAMGVDHVCAITGEQVYCWGDSTDGALGDGAFRDRRELPTVGLLADVADVAAGAGFSCALERDGRTAHCWGANRRGELGNGEIAPAELPTRALLPPGSVYAITAGDDHTCALVGANEATAVPYCWGKNDRGQIDAVVPSATVSIPARYLATATRAVAAGGEHTCALRIDGSEIDCWGDNANQQLGAAGTPHRHSVAAPEADRWEQVAAGEHTTCAVTSGRDLHCWGRIPGHEPSPAAHTTFAVTLDRLAVGSGFVVATRIGEVTDEVIGFGRACPATGDDAGGEIAVSQPSRVTLDGPTQTRVAAASGGGGHACALFVALAGGEPTIACWGTNAEGQAGQAPIACASPAPVPSPPSGWRAPDSERTTLTASVDHTCALDNQQQIYCWGKNSHGELGALAMTQVPTRVNEVAWSQIATGVAHTCGILDGDLHVYCWGENKYGQIGNGKSFHPSPVRVLDTPP